MACALKLGFITPACGSDRARTMTEPGAGTAQARKRPLVT
jgi:hypothetical protein